MTNKEKYAYINERIDHVNKTIFKNFRYKFAFESRGSGEYCVIFNENVYRFATLGDVMTFLTLFDDVFVLAKSIKCK